MGKRGGKQPGAGRPKGSKTKATLEKEAIKKVFDQRIMKVADRLADAQISLATGSQYLYKIEKEEIIGPKGGKSYRAKKPVLVTSRYEIEAYLEGVVEGDIADDRDPRATYYFLTAKDPENTAIDSMFNRVWGKPRESVDMQHSGNVNISLLERARRIQKKRANKKDS